MRLAEQIEEAIRTLAAERPADEITLAEVARLCGVHWTTVRRHIGGKEALGAWLQDLTEPTGWTRGGRSMPGGARVGVS